MNSFNELQINPQVLKGVDSAGYQRPFPIQERAIGPLLAGKNVIGQAKTGSGKTAAFGIPLLQAIDTRSNRVQAIVLAPTRELAVQITEELKKIGAYTGARIVTIYGGQSINVQFEALRRGVHVIVGTPGRVIDHLKRGTLLLDSARYVVLDEADTMLDMGFIDDIEFILDSTSENRQMSLFSATMPARVLDIADRYMKNPERILIDQDQPTVETLDQFYAVVDRDEKLPMLVELLQKERPTSTMIFCRTKYGTRRLARELERRFMNVVPLHGDLSQHQRDYSMGTFRSGHADILVATDVASRGIDIRQVDCIINFDVPEDSLLYFHRVGRTARAGDSGKAFTFVSPEEFEDFARIYGMTKAPISPLRPQDAERDFKQMEYSASSRSERRNYGRRRQNNRFSYSNRRRFR